MLRGLTGVKRLMMSHISHTHTQAQTDTSIAITLTLLLAPPVRGEKRAERRRRHTCEQDVWCWKRMHKLIELIHSLSHTHAFTSRNRAYRMFPDRTKEPKDVPLILLTRICFSCASVKKNNNKKKDIVWNGNKEAKNSNKALWRTALPHTHTHTLHYSTKAALGTSEVN